MIDAGTIAAKLVLHTNPFSSAMDAAKTQLEVFEDRSKDTGDRMNALGGSIQSVGKVATMSLTIPLAAAGGAAVKSAADFEQGMSNIKAVSGATSEEMEKLRDLAIDLGASTSFSAGEAAAGIEELMKAGLSTEQVLNGGLSGALSLAAAGGIELADAAEIASTALNAFRDDNLSVAQAADILAGAANASATDVGELKYGLSMVSAVASSVGLSFKDTSTALAVFAQNGLRGSDAGTSLKTMLMNLQPQTDKQEALFKKLGLTTKDGSNAFYEANGQLKSMDQIAGILQNSLKGMTDQQRMAAMETMFGSDAIRAANILYKEGEQGINKMKEAMAKVTAEEVAKQKLDNLNGTIEEFKGALETGAIIIGEKMIPKIRSWTEDLTGLINKFNELSPEQQDLIVDIGLVVVAIGPCLIIVGKMISAFKDMKLIVEGVTATSKLLRAAIIGETAVQVTSNTATKASTASLIAQKAALVASEIATKAASAAQLVFNAVMNANPISLVIVGLTALGVAIYQVVKHWEDICTWIEKAWNWLMKWNNTKMENKTATVTTINRTINETNTQMGGRMPEYDVGTNYLPHDQVALVHEGEAIIPKKYNPWAGGRSDLGGNNVTINVYTNNSNRIVKELNYALGGGV
jgi:TP901 family phage tail tape measure protein